MSVRRDMIGRTSQGTPAGGFTLVEIVLIIVIAAVAILPLSMLFANTSIRSGDARNATTAAQLAQAKMEEITADRNSPARGLSYLVAANYPAESPVPAFPGYSRTVSFAPDSIYDGVTFRTVGVTVTCANIPPVTLTTWFTNH
jgi:Tfp pilus assembly protein PilV